MKRILPLFLLLISIGCQAQTDGSAKLLLVNPTETDAAIETVHGPHIALYNTKVAPVHKLFFMIIGTGGFATGAKEIDSIATTMGYHAISIDYRNNVITIVCNNSPDSACFDHFRQEIMFGTPVSDSVNVDSANSIINRFTKLLAYLVKADAKGGWGEYYKNGTIQWDKVVVGGHSQGAGHAAYIGQRYKVNRVLMFSGPQDYRVAFNSPALWLSKKSATPVSKYYAFLHINDPYNVKRQLADCAAVMHSALPDSVMVKPGVQLNTNRHILVNDLQNVNAHMSTLRPEFMNVYEYMLKQ
jgi:hypothetical protein